MRVDPKSTNVGIVAVFVALILVLRAIFFLGLIAGVLLLARWIFF